MSHRTVATAARVLALVTFLFVLGVVRAQQPPVVPIYDYRVCQVEVELGVWTTGIYRVDYYADGSFKDIGSSPATLQVPGIAKAKVFRLEMELYSASITKPVLQFGLIYPAQRSR